MPDSRDTDRERPRGRDELDQAASALESQMLHLKRRYSTERRKLEGRSFEPKDED